MGCNNSSLVDRSDGDDSYSSNDSDDSQHGLGSIRPRIVNNYSDSSSTSSGSDTFSTGRENQSIDDCSRESVVDWLMTTTKRTQSIDTVKFQPPALSPRHLSDVPNNDAVLVPLNAGLARGKDYVTQTSKVDRRHVALPASKPDGMASGDFLLHRYIVNDYILLQRIGVGGHSEVRLSKNKVTNALFAVKIMRKGRQMVQQQQEIAILTKLCHPNIIRLYEAIDDARVDKVYLILELLQRGDLMNIVEREGPYKDVQLRDIAQQTMSGLNYLHDNNILQNDLKPSNILVSDSGVIKISDFGISTISRIRRGDDQAGTPAYMAPEVVRGDAAFDGRKADVFSLGATCFYLRFGHPPFIGRNISELYLQIKTADLSFPADDVDDDLKDFISKLMDKDPIRRLCLKDALKHHWLGLGFTS